MAIASASGELRARVVIVRLAYSWYVKLIFSDTSKSIIAFAQKKMINGINIVTIEFKFENKIGYPYFFTYMNKGNYAPIPQSFLDLIGPENFMKYDLKNENSLVDSYLSVGPYTYIKSNKNEILFFWLIIRTFYSNGIITLQYEIFYM